PVERHEIFGEEERKTVVEEWARGPEFEVPDVPVHERFEMQVRRGPERTALVAHDDEWTYEQLEQKANRLAHRL
ncbi:MAG: non-ribosomal peptide synthetase, partial [Bradymonadaceae bacterium]